MTKREAVVIETYTGVCMLAGDDREYAYKYAEELLGFPVYTHMFEDKEIQAKLKERSKPEFLEICKNAKTGGWIPCKERMPVLNVEDKMNDTKSSYETEGYLIPFDIGKRFLVTNKEGYVHESTFWLNENTFDDITAIAWMPLPEPWKGE